MQTAKVEVSGTIEHTHTRSYLEDVPGSMLPAATSGPALIAETPQGDDADAIDGEFEDA